MKIQSFMWGRLGMAPVIQVLIVVRIRMERCGRDSSGCGRIGRRRCRVVDWASGRCAGRVRVVLRRSFRMCLVVLVLNSRSIDLILSKTDWLDSESVLSEHHESFDRLG